MPDEPDFKALRNSYQNSSNPEWWRNSAGFFLQYWDLREHAQNIAFPKAEVSPDLPAKSWLEKLLKFITKISDPFAWFQRANRSVMFFLAIAMLVFIGWFTGYFVCLYQAIGVTFTSSSNHASSGWDYGILFFVFAICLCSIPIAYLRWGRFILDQKYSIGFRFFYSAAIILGITLFSVWEFSWLSFVSVNSLVNDPIRLRWLLAALFLFQVPTFSFGLISLWDLCSYGVRQYKTLDKFLFNFHNPFPIGLIAQILYKPVPSKKKSWHLSDLLPNDLKAIQNWAEANRTSSEKRVTPTLFIIAIIGLFANTQFFDNLFQKGIDLLLEWAKSAFGNGIGSALPIEDVLVGYVIIIISLAIISQLFSLFGKIFRNIVVQSLIVEACIVAEYAAGKMDKDQAKENEMKPSNQSWWQRIFRL